MPEFPVKTGKPLVERIVLQDTRLLPQTVRHHLARYSFAASFATDSNEVAVDICCGTGYGTDILRNAGYEAVGVDIDSAATHLAKTSFPNTTFVTSDAQTYLTMLGDKTINLLTFFEAIEHLSRDEARKIISLAAQKLGDGGLFLISTPRDAKVGENPYHVTQWTREELLTDLSTNFFVEEFSQSWETGQIIPGNNNPDFHVLLCKKKLLNKP